jgi:hypothetical protein
LILHVAQKETVHDIESFEMFIKPEPLDSDAGASSNEESCLLKEYPKRFVVPKKRKRVESDGIQHLLDVVKVEPPDW